MITSSGKKSVLYDENNNLNKNLIKGKKINFNEEVSNYNIIQNNKSPLKEENNQQLFIPETINNLNNNVISNNKIQPAENQKTQFTLPPNKQIYPQIINNNQKIIEKEISNKITCTCSRIKCTKKYCACFAAGKFCQGCNCKDCCNTMENNNNDNKSINILNNNINSINIINDNNTKEDFAQRRILPEKKMQIIECNCTKSKCLKKYCECFKNGYNCGNLCRCVGCANKGNNTNNQNQKPNLNNYVNNENYSPNIINNEKNYNENNNINNTINNNTIINNNFIEHNNDSPQSENYQQEQPKYINYCLQMSAMGIFIHDKIVSIEERKINMNQHINIINTTPQLTSKKRSRAKGDSSNIKNYTTTAGSTKRGKKRYSTVNKNINKKKLLIC